jgi:NAD(P)-dependent dehydrogenase (short-subunit alcohol dehydrogenase family)
MSLRGARTACTIRRERILARNAQAWFDFSFRSRRSVLQLDGKVVLITGGGTGIGAASGRYMAERGATVCLAGIPPDSVMAAADAIRATGAQAMGIATDVTSDTDVSNAIQTVVSTFGRLDAVVANAGVQRHQTDVNLHELDEEEWQRTHDVNTMGVVRTCKHGLRQMIDQGNGGAIVIVSSITALVGTSPNVGYMTGKAGLLGLNRHIAVHYAKHGIRSNAVCPGALEQTPDWGEHPNPEGRRAAMQATIPLGRLGTSADIAPFIALLVSDDGAYANGAHFVVDGGVTVR